MKPGTHVLGGLALTMTALVQLSDARADEPARETKAVEDAPRPDVVPEPNATKPRSKVRNVPTLAVGSVMSVIGVGSLITGGLFWATAEQPGCTLAVCGPSSAALFKTIAIPAFVAGGIHLAAGIPMIVWGALPNEEEPSAPKASFELGATSASFRVDF